MVQLGNGTSSRFFASCEEAKGLYYPVYMQWTYHFLRLGTKTVFYHGTRMNFEFSLPSGLASNDYRVYVSVKAVDGKGVSSKFQIVKEITLEPRYLSGDGAMSLFKEISGLENESPSLLLQQVRSLAWELNQLEPGYVTETILGNIFTIIFYQNSCQEVLMTVTGPFDNDDDNVDDSTSTTSTSTSFQQPPGEQAPDMSILTKVNLLKSCARDHLAELVADLPVRDEMELLQVLTALELIVDAEEFISTMTFTRVIETMRAAKRNAWWNYNPEIRSEVRRTNLLRCFGS